MSGLRNFIVVFLLSLLCFGILGHFISTSVIPNLVKGESGDNVAGTDESSEDVSSDDTDVDDVSDTVVEGNTFNFAFFCMDINNQLAGVYLLHTHDGYETCVTVPVPGSAFVENNGAYTTLTALYADYGKDFMLTKLFYLTGCKIDEYATLSAVDSTGKGRNVTELSTYLRYTYKVKTAFEYPNPDYIGGGREDSDDSAEDVNEFITVKAGSYALNGTTEGVLNEQLLLDSEYNPDTFGIFLELLNGMINDGAIASNSNKQATIFNYIPERSFRDYAGSGASAYLFNNYRKASFEHPGTGGAWDEIREAIKTLEGKVQ